MQENILLFFKGAATPLLDQLAELITMLGEQYFFIIVIAFIYWNISKREGFKLIAALIYSSVLKDVLKLAFHAPRPFEKLDFISAKRIETATGYSFPSGHTQAATTFFITLAQIIRKRWFAIIAILIALLVGISRVYLGVHWPLDVLGALVLGVIMAYVFCSIVDRYYDDHRMLKKIFFRLQAVILFLTIAMLIVDLVYLRGSMKVEDFFKISGLSSGVIYGFFAENKYFNFSAGDAGWGRKIIRYILGLAVTAAIMLGLKMVLPEHYTADFFRYLIVGLWVMFLWPAAGIGLKLFNRESRV